MTEETVESLPGESVPTCEDCGANFANEEDLRKHHAEHHARISAAEKARPGEYKCSTCGGTFPEKDALIEHQQAAHGKVVDF